MRLTTGDLAELTERASRLARRVGIRRFVMRPGKLTQLLHQISTPNSPYSEQVGADEVGDALQLITLAQHQLEEIELRLISGARERKMSWADIAERLSLRSRQAAEQRYLRLQAGHTSAAGNRDVTPVRERRRRQNELLEILTASEPALRRLARLLPDAVDDNLYASATGPAPRKAAATWDQLPVNERAYHRDQLGGDLAPYLRTVRRYAQGETPMRLFVPLAQVVSILDRSGYDFHHLPTELNLDLEQLRSIIRRVGFRPSPSLSTIAH
ncbi:hypothetical protein DMA12_42990 [Amycolatopsis balhimycina DSM 5908]|uniref:Uncharacterized protein n=1 Tax=Amycolatopsis balhimycina DSM 5908 TaxID=1081091 RepID=A0A428VY42_AMYBA|nr:hypothetical protein [Amycolatopsis balhimycina]RSM35780.1 hypothetical protein DMA12_42990 [Amycolatopsis balhimycina DSM 5908]